MHAGDFMKYEINGKKYIQKPLVIGQIKQIAGLLNDFQLKETPTTMDFISALGDKIPNFFAIVLVEEGKSPKDKDLNLMAKELEQCSLETAVKVIDDFFSCNPLSLVFQKVGGWAKTLTKAP
jgi:hypothetical protein